MIERRSGKPGLGPVLLWSRSDLILLVKGILVDLGESPLYSLTLFIDKVVVVSRCRCSPRKLWSALRRVEHHRWRTWPRHLPTPVNTDVCLITFSTVSKLLFLLHIFFYAVTRTTVVKLMMMTTTMISYEGGCNAHDGHDNDAFLTFCTWFFTCEKSLSFRHHG